MIDIDDIAKFWSGTGGLDNSAAVEATGALFGFNPTGGYVTGMYQAGFFPIMMFGLPAGALAIYRCAKPENRRTVGSLMLAGGLAAFLTGVTEPLEFAFMFAAFPLYVVHAALTALSVFIASSFQWIAGFNFSAGFIDWFLSLRVPRSHYPWMLIVQGLVFAVIYYYAFTFVIRKFNLKTPGRGDDEESDDHADGSESAEGTGRDRDASLAARLYAALGGKANVTEIENCVTRLRMGVKASSQVDLEAIRHTGVPGVKVLDEHNVQIIVGTQVQAVADAMAEIHAGGTGANPDPASPGSADATAPRTSADAPAGQTDVKDGVPSAIIAPCDGSIKAIGDVPDETFAAKVLGDGFAVVPTSGRIVAPVGGTVTTVADARHAVGITTADGVEVLVHVGVDTVQLGGSPFTVHVTAGQSVAAGDPIEDVRLDDVRAAGKPTDVIVVFTNPAVIDKLRITASGTVSAGGEVGQITAK